MDTNLFLTRAECFQIELEREYYQVGSGQKEQLGIAAIFNRYPELFSRESVQARLSERASAPDLAVPRYLAAFAADGYLENSVKSLSEQITNAELDATVPWDGQDLPYFEVRKALGEEPDQERRHDLHGRLLAVTAQQHERRAERLRRLHDEARSLSFASYTALYETLKCLALPDLSKAMGGLLSDTEQVHAERLESTLTSIRVHPDAADVSDVHYCFRAAQFDRYFPADQMVRSLQRTMSGMGLLTGEDFGFILDIEPRPKKSPRAFCSSVVPPREVYLVIKPHGGPDDYDAFFHEAGHATHFSRISPDVPWAQRCLGDTDITETYAFLFNYLPDNPRWLRDVLGVPMTAVEEFRHFALFKKTWFLRRHAAKLLYELQLHDGDPAETCDAYVDTLAAALQVRIAPENSLADVDDGYYVAQYLRAWIFEAMLRRFLAQEFGEDWWSNRESGWFLREWWSRGQALPLAALAKEIGYAGLDARPLVEELLGAW
jgi:hypothetical protein